MSDQYQIDRPAYLHLNLLGTLIADLLRHLAGLGEYGSLVQCIDQDWRPRFLEAGELGDVEKILHERVLSFARCRPAHDADDMTGAVLAPVMRFIVFSSATA
jgi:hypothetical protein